ncbi:pyrimidine utilization protein B [Vibrio diazotrophicus]|uniref:pyrimidine utilization protein B n=1 Tax=Vibrio diazotrophicus TaxID=685 RepID=UPI000C9E3873|nr:pyrimidine utilization protein B [Vibrio diazotrophicus]PNH81414.1 pyrimidine utilization protein B [Vibrio diazotrophicus]
MIKQSISGYSLNTGESAQVILNTEPEKLAIKPSETALIVVDMQNAYASKEGYLDLAGFDVSGTGSVIENINKAIDVSRKAGIQIVFLQNGWDSNYVEAGGEGSPNWHKSNALKTMRKQSELSGRFLSKGGWDYELVDEIKPQQQDWIIPKTRYSGFFNTNLDTMLRSRGIRNLVFTGIATNVCVESTLRDGFHLEYFGVALSDATHQAGPRSAQDAALLNIQTFFGWVTTVEDYSNALVNVR